MTSPIPVDDLDDLSALVSNEIDTPLTLQDRCDRCGVQAFARAAILVRETGKMVDLLLCGHHFNTHREKLVAIAMHIQDDTARISRNASASSA